MAVSESNGTGGLQQPDRAVDGPAEPRTEDRRIALEIAPGIEWLCEPEMVGWHTAAAGHDDVADFLILPL